MNFSLKLDDKQRERRQSEEPSETMEQTSFEIEFLLPKDEKTSRSFKSGKEVQDLKVFIEDNIHIPFTDIILTHNGKELPNMITLADIKGLDSKSVNIFTVKQK
jgi:hypothetical protein